jgi:hypothetical protein
VDAALRKPGDGAAEEGNGARSGQVIEQLGVGDAGVIVDHHVQVLVAGGVALATGNPTGVLAPAITHAHHPVAGATQRDPRELLDVDVDELAGMAPLIPVRWLERLQPGAFAEPDPLQPQRDRRERQPQHLGDLGRRHPEPSQRLDRLHTLLGQPRRAAMRPRRPIKQLPIAVAVTGNPFRGRPGAATGSLRSLRQLPALLDHSPAQQQTTARTGPTISVKIHPVTSSGTGGFDTSSLQRGPDEQRP